MNTIPKGRIYPQNQSDQTIFKSTWFELGVNDNDTKCLNTVSLQNDIILCQRR